MLFSVTSLCGRRAALVTLIWGVFSALTPLASLAAGSVTLAWDASPGTNVIANYKIYYGVASGTYTNTASAGTNTTLSISNLVEGKTYYFAATAVDTYGLESDYSTEVSTVIPVKPTNQPPTLNALANVTINENAGLQTVSLSGISSGAANESQTLTVTASSSNTGLIPNPTVTYTSPNATGSISFTPVAYAYGSSTITVTVNDGGASNNVVSAHLHRHRQPGQRGAHAQHAGQRHHQRECRPADRQPLRHRLRGGQRVPDSHRHRLLQQHGPDPDATVTYTSPNATGSIAFTPVAYANGSATITVTVNDGGASNNVVSRTFTVTVNPVNEAPTLNALADVTINEDASLQTVNLAGISSGRDQRVPDPHRHRLLEQHRPDPDAYCHLHQPQRHRLHQLHPGRPCQRLRHHHRHGQ